MRSTEELLSLVRDRESRQYVGEAIRAYQAGAHRAAIVSVWIAVSLDIIGKIRERATAGDGEARTYVENLDRTIESGSIKALQDNERSILDVARDKFELIDTREHTELSRLRDDRHICAHPAFVKIDEIFEPTPELVRTHLSVAVDALLSKTPTPGKAAIERFKRDFESNSFPRSSDDVTSYLRDTFYRNGKTSMRRNLSELIIKLCLMDHGQPALGMRSRTVAQALARVSPELFTQAVSSVIRKREEGAGLKDNELLAFVGRLGDMGEAWEAFPEVSGVRAVSAVQHAPIEDLIKYDVFHADMTGHPAAQAISERAETLNQPQLLSVIEGGSLSSCIIDGALEYFRDSRSYREAEFNMANLVLPVTPEFTLEHLEQVKSAFLSNAQINRAADMPELMVELFRDTNHLLPSSAKMWHELRKAIEEMNGITDFDLSEDDHYHYVKLRALIFEFPPF
ncbi:hypothetical protein [Actinomadura chokoriensis]|uniref:DUF4209 domain-containing protein n=1 Tax=Actinomadura chokoriensis TaxID=454156 RepID=A0ABV4R7E4_9ACTN